MGGCATQNELKNLLKFIFKQHISYHERLSTAHAPATEPKKEIQTMMLMAGDNSNDEDDDDDGDDNENGI